VIAIGLGTKGLGNTWWALNAPITPAQEKALLLWLNSTLSLLLFLEVASPRKAHGCK
jgi:hypothetical protein